MANTATPSGNDFAFATTTLSREASLLSVPAEKHSAIVNSGASSHFCPDHSKFTSFTPIHPKPISIADGHTIHATGHGDVVIELPKGQEHSCITLKDALFSPDITFTLISTSRITQAEFSVCMIKGFCEIWSPEPSSVLVARIPEVNGLYNVATTIEVAATTHPSAACMSLRHLHECMGHMSFSSMRTMVSNGMVEGIEIASQPDNDFCETCVKAKITRIPFPTESNTHAMKYGERIHTNV